MAAVAVSFTTLSQFLKLGCLLASLFSQARGSAGEPWVEESAGVLSWLWEGTSFLPPSPRALSLWVMDRMVTGTMACPPRL